MNTRRPAAPGHVRIIGGRWRGTRLPVPELDGLRPSGDRMRETLFNWLAPVLPGARVLDLFAGTGALGFEAVSRGAASAVLVERAPAAVEALHASAGRLQGGDRVAVVAADALAWLPAQPAGTFDIAFVDPPFAGRLWDAALPAVARVLAPEAWMYVEAPPEVDAIPAGWRLHRQLATRDARARLLHRP